MVRKLVGFVMLGAAFYVGVVVYTDGPHRAFGGAFSFVTAGEDLPDKASHYATRGERVRERVEASMEESEARYERMVRDD